MAAAIPVTGSVGPDQQGAQATEPKRPQKFSAPKGLSDDLLDILKEAHEAGKKYANVGNAVRVDH